MYPGFSVDSSGHLQVGYRAWNELLPSISPDVISEIALAGQAVTKLNVRRPAYVYIDVCMCKCMTEYSPDLREGDEEDLAELASIHRAS
jgi:hypothetical protein